MKIHEAAIEAEYNLKYLSPFENFTEIFDDFEPQKVTRILPDFFSKVYKVHRILAYYRKSDKICSLLRKITNQMVNGSLNYLNSDGEFCEADNLKLIQKFNDCISLNESYHNAYNEKFKEKLDKTFIFEKFDAFSSRCSKLILIFKTIDDFDHLKNCEIKEMSLIAEYFVQNINFTLKLNNKQILDLKNKEFEKDFENFKSQCVIEDSKIRQIISKRFQLTKTVLIEIKLHKTLKETVTRKEGQLELDLWFKHCLKRF
ncbi:Dynein heavy chain 5, axonemal [Tritrichomonas musculus]|uniref:Dynein heavy chain 5, axonemal n=1 Tax=Tritrichomonas musculus TaxID=1915356 RepID=A0ABR2KCT0_9EUKA